MSITAKSVDTIQALNTKPKCIPEMQFLMSQTIDLRVNLREIQADQEIQFEK